MIHKDTVRLLRECDAGIQMGITSLKTALPRVRSDRLRTLLENSSADHRTLQTRIRALLDRYADRGKKPNPIVREMSCLKLQLELGLGKTDAKVASLITDGCNMGIKSLSKYLNQYAAADQVSKEITQQLIRLEEQLCVDLRDHL